MSVSNRVICLPHDNVAVLLHFYFMLQQSIILLLFFFFFLFSDCFFRQEEFNFALQDYHQALELDPHDETIKSRISVIHNEFGVSAYQDKMYNVSTQLQ